MLVTDRSSDGPASVRTQRGFTLTELMVTVAVAGILAMVAVPNMRTFLQNNRLSAASNDLLRSFYLARTEAIKHQTNVAVCASAVPTAAACARSQLCLSSGAAPSKAFISAEVSFGPP